MDRWQTYRVNQCGVTRMCRHCAKRPASRPRKLCWACYDNLAVRNLYWADPKKNGHHSLDKRAILECNDPDFQPTKAIPGTEAKIKVLEERARRGWPLWHPLDTVILNGFPVVKGTLAKYAIVAD